MVLGTSLYKLWEILFRILNSMHLDSQVSKAYGEATALLSLYALYFLFFFFSLRVPYSFVIGNRQDFTINFTILSKLVYLCNLHFSGCFVIISIYLLHEGTELGISNKNIIYTFLFCLGQNSGSILQFVSVKIITISTMGALFLGSLMVFGVVLGRMVLKEELKLGSVMSLFVCLIGFSILIAGPYITTTSKDGFGNNEGIFSMEFNETLFNFNGTIITNIPLHNDLQNDLQNDLENYLQEKNRTDLSQGQMSRSKSNGHLSQLILGLIIAVMAGFGEAVSVISLNCIQDDLENVHVLTFWFVLSGIICSVFGMFAFEREVMSFPTELLNGCYLAGHIITSSLALLFYIVAMENLSASLMSILASTQIPVNVLLQYAFFTQLQPMKGGTSELIGASVVTLGLIIQPLLDLCQTNINTSDKETSSLLPSNNSGTR